MPLTIIILLFCFLHLFQNIQSRKYQNDDKQCACECCLDDNENCTPTFRSTININPLLDCNNITCNQQSCLTFSQCSIAFGVVSFKEKKGSGSCSQKTISPLSTPAVAIAETHYYPFPTELDAILKQE
ncbi:unnamed protein product [Adineta steineri]|uniref:Uncharacterized protein n=1 Tax=Adineta steineri TaxID=433720 RepID=A0A819I1T4_9BILA|nr:unnamed protein product [Adineta steineri]